MKRLYVGNIAYKTTEEGLKDAFSAFSSVTAVKIITDKFSGESRGFGFVDLSNDEEAADAVETLNGVELDGKILTVNEARPKSNQRHFKGTNGGGRGYGNIHRDKKNFHKKD